MKWINRILFITLVAGNFLPFATNSALQSHQDSVTITIGHELPDERLAALMINSKQLRVR